MTVLADEGDETVGSAAPVAEPKEAARRRPVSRQLRIHGVGGPQGAKMLGYASDLDVLTIPHQPAGDSTTVPRDPTTRVVRPVTDDERDRWSYEWGALTMGGLLKALWVVFLPFTVLNAAGWSLRAGPNRLRRSLVHALAGLGTLSYIFWIGYLLLDLVARQWRHRLLTADLPGFLDEFACCLLLPLAHVVFLALPVALVLVNRATASRFEGYDAGITGDDPGRWQRSSSVTDDDFFSHLSAHRWRTAVHALVALGGAVVVIWLGTRTRSLEYVQDSHLTSIGLGIVVLAAVQVALLLIVLLLTWRAEDVASFALLTVGTVLCHLAFAGAGLLLRDLLDSWPATDPGRALIVGPELGLADHFVIALVLLVVGLLVLVGARALAGADLAGYPDDGQPGLGVAMVRWARGVGFVVAVAFLGSVALFAGVHFTTDIQSFYDGHEVSTNAFQRLGGIGLTALPVAMGLAIRRPRTSAVGQVLGNIWDVLTFWPRRFHPVATPSYAERAVPELRWLVRSRRAEDKTLVVLGHSQGSVLAFSAIGAELRREGCGAEPLRPVSLLTFGSPLGTLYADAFGASFDRADLDAASGQRRIDVAQLIDHAGGRWTNLFRSTDPISGPVRPAAVSAEEAPSWRDEWLPDPRLDALTLPAGTDALAPLERPPPYGVACGHNRYLADPRARELLTWMG